MSPRRNTRVLALVILRRTDYKKMALIIAIRLYLLHHYNKREITFAKECHFSIKISTYVETFGDQFSGKRKIEENVELQLTSHCM